MSNMVKQRIVSVLIGTTGKTDLLIDLIPSWIKNNKKGKIIAFDPQDKIIPEINTKKSSPIKHYITTDDKDFKWVDHITKNENGTLLVLNGGDFLFAKKDIPRFSKPLMHTKFMNLLMKRRYLNLDIMITFQRPDCMPTRLEYFVTDYLIFPIEEAYQLSKSDPNYQILLTAIQALNTYHLSYPTDSKREYVHIKTETQTITPSPDIHKGAFQLIFDTIEENRNKEKEVQEAEPQNEKTMNKFEKSFLLDIHDRIYQIAKDDVKLTRKLQQLAFGILVNIDGESAYLPPFQLIPTEDNTPLSIDNIAGSLHDNFYKIIEK